MIRIKITKPYKRYNVGDILNVSRNIAHSLCSLRVAERYQENKMVDGYQDKMMRPEKSARDIRRARAARGRYKTK